MTRWRAQFVKGIGHDGRALFPIMPYPNYRQMSDEDLASVIVYLRTVPAVHNQLPATKMPFPLNFFMAEHAATRSTPLGTGPDQSTPVTRGQLSGANGRVAKIATTPQEKGQPMPGMDFAGGFLMHEPKGDVVSANITPAASGIWLL